jgi:hypothetical protein
MTDLLRPIKKAVKKTPLWPVLRPRRIHVYNLGAGRTGTTATTSIFSGTFRAGHEAHVASTVKLLSEYWSDSATEQKVRKKLISRDRKWRLEFESSPFLAGFAPLLVDVFSEAQFLVTVRPPKKWLRSNIDKCINSPREELKSHFLYLRDLNYGSPPEEYPPQETVLDHYKLHSLSGYLQYWAWHYETVLNGIPAGRRLLIKTSGLSDAIPKIAEFLNVSEEQLSQPSKENKASKRHGVVADIPQDYLDRMIDDHCGETIERIRREVK